MTRRSSNDSNRRSPFSVGWLKLALCFLALFVWMLGDGGSWALSAPTALATGHPPLSADQTHQRLQRLLARGYSRQVVGAAAEMFVEDPADVRGATLLVSAARRSGRMDWLEAFSLAATRRAPTAAVLYLVAEVRFARYGFAAGVEIVESAHKRLPENPSIAVSYAAGLAGTGRPLEAFGMMLLPHKTSILYGADVPGILIWMLLHPPALPSLSFPVLAGFVLQALSSWSVRHI